MFTAKLRLASTRVRQILNVYRYHLSFQVVPDSAVELTLLGSLALRTLSCGLQREGE